MSLHHPAPTNDRIPNPKNSTKPNLPHDREALTDAGILNDTITTGWNASLCFLLFNAIVSVLWGVALATFSSGVVPVTWSISQYGKYHLGITNVVVTLIGTASTTHLKFTFQEVLRHYSHYVLVDGFTLRQLTWMQGIKEWSLFTAFRSSKRRLAAAWLLLYCGMALHSASVVSILQPNTFYKNVHFNDPIPCATDFSSLSLDVPENIPLDIQSQMDRESFQIGLQLGNYIEQVGGNTTTAVAGRVYVKDNYAYGAIGGLKDGLQEIPGISFDAQCTNNPNTSSLLDLWGSVFSGNATPPTILTGSNGSQSFSDQPIPIQMQSIVSDPSFNLTGSQVAMYALVDPSGSGGLLMVNATEVLLCCVWHATPKLVFVQTVNSTAQSLGSQDANAIPQPIGRATLLTLRGMAQAVRLGANFDDSNYPFISMSAMLQTMLADGGKATLTRFNVYFRALFVQHRNSAGLLVCNSYNRTIASHWRFGNNYNLGWVAIIWTTGVGLFAIFAVIWFVPRQRVQGIKSLEVADVFVLGEIVVPRGFDQKGEQVLGIRNVS